MANNERKKRQASQRDTEAEELEIEKPKRPTVPRLTITITPELRRKIRIAAARADLEPGEWAKAVLVAAAKKTVAKLYGDEEES